jgi:hypothetical protein
MNPQTFHLASWAQRPLDRRDRDFYLAALPLAVSIVGIIPHLAQYLMFSGGGARFAKLAVMVVAGAFMTGFISYALTRFLSRPKWWGPQRRKWPILWHVLLIAIPVAVLVDGPQRLAELSMITRDLPLYSLAPYIFGVSIGRALLFAGAVVFYERLIGAALEAADQRQRALKLETQTLKSLIQPHFLLNSLNAVRAYIEDRPQTAEEMLLKLTSLLRRVIQYSSMDWITVKEEMELIDDYVAVMNRRFEGDFKLRVDGVRDVPVKIPPLIVFSLVENSFKHGFAGRRSGNIHVTMEAREKMRFVVRDDGSGNGVEDSTGTGGQYVQARLELVYGSKFTFTHGKSADGHYEAVIEMPWEGGA